MLVLESRRELMKEKIRLMHLQDRNKNEDLLKIKEYNAYTCTCASNDKSIMIEEIKELKKSYN